MIGIIKKQFKDKEISKVDFIDRMYYFHRILEDFSNSLPGTEISAITIDDNGLVFTKRESEDHKSIRFYVNIEDKRNTPLESFNFNQYEKEESKMFFRLAEECKTIFDIGGNIGWYSIQLAKDVPERVIHTFEPIPDTFDKIKKNIELNKIRNVIVNQIALSSKKEKTEMFYTPTLTGASSMRNILNSDLETILCQTDKLDNYTDEKGIKELDLIKCDVEGAELFVIQGGIKTIERLKPIIFLEMLRKWAKKFEYHPNDIISILKSIEYSCFKVKGEYLERVFEVTEDFEETNFIFLHREKHHNLKTKLVL